MLRNNPMSAAIPLRPQISRKFPSFSRVGRPIHTSSFIIQPSDTPRSPHTPSLPDARPRSDRFRCGGRGSNFLAVMRAKSRQRRGPEDSGDRIVPTTPGGHGVRSAGRQWTGWDVARCASREKTPSAVSSASQTHEMTAHEHDTQPIHCHQKLFDTSARRVWHSC